MTEPCQQAQTIARLESNDERLFDILERIENNQERFISAIERIAELSGDSKRNTQDINNLYVRVRDLELKPGNEGAAVKQGLIIAIISAIVAAVVGMARVPK